MATRTLPPAINPSLLMLAGVALASVVVSTFTQTPDAERQAHVAALKASLAQNQAALKQYSWVETTTIAVKGEVKKKEQQQCYYGADGKVQKTPVPGSPPATPPEKGRGIKGAIVEHKVDEMKAYGEKAVALVKEYVPPDQQRIQAVLAAGGVSIQPGAAGLATITLKNYVKPDDAVTIGFDTTAKKIRSYNVQTYVEKPNDDVVTLAVTFSALGDGTSYPSQSVLDMTSKHIQVTVTNTGYRKSGR